MWGSTIFFPGTLITWHHRACSKRIHHTCGGGQRCGRLTLKKAYARLTLKKSIIREEEDKRVEACSRLSDSREDT